MNIIEKYGLPQDWNPEGGTKFPYERSELNMMEKADTVTGIICLVREKIGKLQSCVFTEPINSHLVRAKHTVFFR